MKIRTSDPSGKNRRVGRIPPPRPLYPIADLVGCSRGRLFSEVRSSAWEVGALVDYESLFCEKVKKVNAEERFVLLFSVQ